MPITEKKMIALPVLALGKSAARVVQDLNAQMGGQLDLYQITEAIEEEPQILFSYESPYRFLFYNRADVTSDIVKKFGTAAKINGRVLGFEIATDHEVLRTSWQMGTNLLIRTDSEDACRKAAAPILHMALHHEDFSWIDIEDVFSLFDGTDLARVGTATAMGDLARSRAIAGALRSIGWPPSTLRGLLLNISGSQYNMSMMEISTLMDTVMNKIEEDGNMIWCTSIDAALGDTVQVTAIATRGWRLESTDACNWISHMVDVSFQEDGEDG